MRPLVLLFLLHVMSVSAGAAEPIVPFCPTDLEWDRLQGKRMTCAPEGPCDDPSVRDGTPLGAFRLPIIVHIIASDVGELPDGIGPVEVAGLVEELEGDVAPYGFLVDHIETKIHQDSQFHVISQISFFNEDWKIDIADMKDRYASTPEQALNIFISSQKFSVFGYIGGYATFPWDPGALTAQGGLWLNSLFAAPDERVLTHEVGHCLGLWHTHRGVAEAPTCDDPCRENVHGGTDPAADLVGDFCKDTPATPANSTCLDATGTDCNGAVWGVTDPGNFMGYGPTGCLDHFTTEQTARMHCWAASALAGLVRPVSLDIHVASTVVATEQAGSRWRGVGSVRIENSLGQPVPGATVAAAWMGTHQGSATAVTAGDGVATFVTPWSSSTDLCWSLKVIDVSAPELSYDPSANGKDSARGGRSCGPEDFTIGKTGRQAPALRIQPNPFNPSTRVRFDLPGPASVELAVYDLAGRRVADLLSAPLPGGTHERQWDGADQFGRPVASGVYFAVLRVGDTVHRRRMLLLK